MSAPSPPLRCPSTGRAAYLKRAVPSMRAVCEWGRPSALPGVAPIAVALAGLAGCAGTTAHAPDVAAAQTQEAAPLPRGAVSALQLEVSALGSTGFVPWEELVAQLAGVSLVCLGEEHDNLVHHALQLRLVRALLQEAVAQGRPVALGFEMFQRPAQPLLDAYARGELVEQELLERSEYERRWGFDYEFYRETLEVARSQGGKLLALNAPREWTKAVAKRGTLGLLEVNANLPPETLVLDDPEHQRFFTEAMGAFHPATHDAAAQQPAAQRTDPQQPDPGAPTAHHGAAHPHAAPPGAQGVDWSNEPFYAAQVVWDETMADTAASWARAAGSGAFVVVLAGAGHCHRSAIPRRFERRAPGRSAVGVRLRTRSSMVEPSVPRAASFEWVVIAEER